MNDGMKGSWFPIMSVTVFLMAYVVLAYYSFENIVVAMFIISPFLVIWMVYRVLRYGKPSGRTFSEYFYDDVDHKRIREEN
jgi:Flp pilus assembly protein TadB